MLPYVMYLLLGASTYVHMNTYVRTYIPGTWYLVPGTVPLQVRER